MLNMSILCRSTELNVTRRPLAVQAAILLANMLSVPDDKNSSKLSYFFTVILRFVIDCVA